MVSIDHRKEKSTLRGRDPTYQTAKAVRMPLAPQRLYHHIRHRLPTLTALGTVPVGVAIATPRITILLNERRARIEWIAALRTEEVPGVPLGATSNNDFAFDRRLARLAARAEHLVEVQRAVEAQGGLAVCFLRLVELVDGDVLWDDAGLAGCDTFHTSRVLRFGLWVEGHVL